MALRNILFSGNETLKKVCKPVKNFDEVLWQLLDDMYHTMMHYYGVGLAANQVGILKRVIVVEVNGIKLELINPEIIKEVGERCEIEGCLSVKGVQGYVKRPATVTVKAFDRFGVQYTITASEMLAQCLCHEIDHLNGVLFTDIMERPYIPEKENKSKKSKKQTGE